MNLGIKLKAFEHVISVSNSYAGLGGIPSLPVGPVQNPDGETGSEIIEGLHTSVSSTSTSVLIFTLLCVKSISQLKGNLACYASKFCIFLESGKVLLLLPLANYTTKGRLFP